MWYSGNACFFDAHSCFCKPLVQMARGKVQAAYEYHSYLVCCENCYWSMCWDSVIAADADYLICECQMH